ncbi:polysaccharide deacetylase family protein [Radiobacillus kanasensis]|uniref:polysaccharide deacetylase family protein n=1 Tax=Radiobacillus kanasensis TaxID=2844358 RepID=UPI001E5F0D6B|nr:polysaccharide deacetylase family protein [Radiobacillus kanasensis]UFU00693.1 polysaccharide deacetylase family protein [Radiobacillus kanasensis]
MCPIQKDPRVLYTSEYPNIRTQNNSTNKKTVTLTFDDGPSEHLLQILSILEEEHVPAVFFWQGKLVDSSSPWEEVLKHGHQIGSHSTNHDHLSRKTFEEQLKDIKESVEKIESITTERVVYFRPPYGEFNEDTIQIAEDLDLQIIMWRIAAMDWELEDNHDQLIANVVDHLEDGAIILLHEFQQTVHALPRLISEIRERGYIFSLIDDKRGWDKTQ